MAQLDLPYFDRILDLVARDPRSDLANAFRRHVHWGCFESPETASDSTEAYVAAAEQLTRRVVDAGGVADGKRVLDVGCGFGGTVAHMNERFAGVDLVGLNIDARQLDHARREVAARPGNRIDFVEGDACALPFPDASFDVVLAVECIFHFASRKAFLREARRVLRPRGRLALSDFLVSAARLPLLGIYSLLFQPAESRFYGASNAVPITSGAYARLARATGFELLRDDDITANTLPTYAAMRRIYREAGITEGVRATDHLEAIALRRFIQYHVLALGPVRSR